MSYSRFGWDGSDVYVYLDVGGYFCCCGCAFGNDHWRHADTDAILAHLHKHLEAEHHVPAETLAEIEADRAENDAWLAAFPKATA